MKRVFQNVIPPAVVKTRKLIIQSLPIGIDITIPRINVVKELAKPESSGNIFFTSLQLTNSLL